MVLTAPAVILSCELGERESTHSSLSMKLSRPVRIVATDLGVSYNSHGSQEQLTKRHSTCAKGQYITLAKTETRTCWGDCR